jgi:hypothetical protein
MTVQQLADLIGAKALNPEVGLEGEVRFGYACDLLSWVMSHGAGGTAWITVMTHMNAVAVATLLEFSCIIVPEGVEVAANVLAKASEEKTPILASDKTAYEISGLMAAQGIAAPVRG